MSTLHPQLSWSAATALRPTSELPLLVAPIPAWETVVTKVRERQSLLSLAVAVLLTVPLVTQAEGELSLLLPPWIWFVLVTLAQFWASGGFYVAAWTSLRSGIGNMDLLVALLWALQLLTASALGGC